jgi:hypothetical protein
MIPHAAMLDGGAQLALEYELRFARLKKYRAKVWGELCKSFFSTAH